MIWIVFRLDTDRLALVAGWSMVSEKRLRFHFVRAIGALFTNDACGCFQQCKISRLEVSNEACLEKSPIPVVAMIRVLYNSVSKIHT